MDVDYEKTNKATNKTMDENSCVYGHNSLAVTKYKRL